MLNKAGYPILKSKVFGFITDNDYTNYFTLIQASGELEEAGFIETRIIMNGAHLAILDDGVDTLKSFNDRLPQVIKDDIFRFLQDNDIEVKSTKNVNTNYYKSGQNEYTAELSLKDEGSELLMLKIAMPTEAAAKAMCENFEDNSQDLYELIVDKLM